VNSGVTVSKIHGWPPVDDHWQNSTVKMKVFVHLKLVVRENT
jgi:hypothetical protein